jgi:hypothetical protein
LNLSQLCDGIADSHRKTFNGFHPPPGCFGKILTQQELGLADDSGQGVIDFVPNISDEVGDLVKLILVIREDLIQAFVRRSFLSFAALLVHSLSQKHPKNHIRRKLTEDRQPMSPNPFRNAL